MKLIFQFYPLYLDEIYQNMGFYTMDNFVIPKTGMLQPMTILHERKISLYIFKRTFAYISTITTSLCIHKLLNTHDLQMAILVNYCEKLFKPSNRATGSWLIDCLDPI